MALTKANPINGIGDGYSSFIGSASSTVLEVQVQDGGPASLGASIKVCMTTDDVYEALNIDATAEVSSSWGSFSDKLKFAHSISQTTRTVNIVVVARKHTKTSRVIQQKFKRKFKDAATLYAQGGDSFVSSVTWGGQYMAAYTFRAQTDASYNNLVNSVNVHINSGITSFTGTLNTEIAKIHNDSQVDWTFLQEGVGFAKGKLPNQDDLINFALAFGDKDLDGPAIIDFGLSSYRHVDGCPKFDQIEAYRQAYLGGVEPGSGFAAIEAAAQSSLLAVNNVFSMYKRFGAESADPSLSTRWQSLKATIKSIQQWRQAVDNKPTAKGIAAPVTNAQLDLPTPAYLIQQGPWIGTPFVDAEQAPDVQSDWVVKSIIPKSMSVSFHPPRKGTFEIDGVTRSYQGLDNQDIANFPATAGQSDQQSSTLFLSETNRITDVRIWTYERPDPSITGTMFASIRAMGVRTTGQAAETIWDEDLFPRDNNNPNRKITSWSVPPNSCFLGWKFKTWNQWPTNLQPWFVTFQACDWRPAPGVAQAVRGVAKLMQVNGDGKRTS